MFLTGQDIDPTDMQLRSIPPAGISCDRSIEVKHRLNRFTTMPENIWNNPYRTSAKSHKFYHQKDVAFKSKLSNVDAFCNLSTRMLDTHLKDDEILNLQQTEMNNF